MNIAYLDRNDLLTDLAQRPSASLEFVILATGALDGRDQSAECVKQYKSL
jgi:hypothetical protein